MARTEWLSLLCLVDVGEACCLLFALNWVYELQLETVDFELDSKCVVENFYSHKEYFSEFGAILDDF